MTSIPAWIRSTRSLDTVDSTSNLARELLCGEQAPELPLLVCARRQTQGRGRGTNAWWSDAGSLTFTVGLDPAAHGLSFEMEPRVALAAAVALIEALESRWLTPGQARVRWPNDVEIEDRKLAGILVEHIETTAGPRLLIGVGVNVSTRFDTAPREVRRLATSLDGRMDPSEVLGPVLASLERVLSALARNDAALAKTWQSLDALRGRSIRIEQGQTTLSGTALGLDELGRLLLASESGVQTITGGRVLRDP